MGWRDAEIDTILSQQIRDRPEKRNQKATCVCVIFLFEGGGWALLGCSRPTSPYRQGYHSPTVHQYSALLFSSHHDKSIHPPLSSPPAVFTLVVPAGVSTYRLCSEKERRRAWKKKREKEEEVDGERQWGGCLGRKKIRRQSAADV